MKVALIPARGGSKRLPRKNVMPFAGRPMLGWTVEAALQSGVFDEVVVSTEDSEIADAATGFGAVVLRRPREIATDTAGLVDVAQHAIAEYDSSLNLCILLANCPLRTSRDIAHSHELWAGGSWPALISVVDYAWTPPFRAQTIDEEGCIIPLMPEWMTSKSQAYPKVVCPSGAIYWAQASELESADTLYLPGIRGFEMPWHRAIDIDTTYDLKLAECVRLGIEHGVEFGVADGT